MLGSHVDDLLWAKNPPAAPIIQKIREKFVFGKEGESNFRFKGREVEQDENWQRRGCAPAKGRGLGWYLDGKIDRKEERIEKGRRKGGKEKYAKSVGE